MLADILKDTGVTVHWEDSFVEVDGNTILMNLKRYRTKYLSLIRDIEFYVQRTTQYGWPADAYLCHALDVRYAGCTTQGETPFLSYYTPKSRLILAAAIVALFREGVELEIAWLNLQLRGEGSEVRNRTRLTMLASLYTFVEEL